MNMIVGNHYRLYHGSTLMVFTGMKPNHNEVYQFSQYGEDGIWHEETNVRGLLEDFSVQKVIDAQERAIELHLELVQSGDIDPTIVRYNSPPKFEIILGDSTIYQSDSIDAIEGYLEGYAF